MKPGRQNVILEIISQQDIETQRQLQEELLKRGVKSTQATLSRDIKDMRHVNELSANGTYRYTVSGRSGSDEASHLLKKILRESIRSYDTAMNILVVKTLPGLAQAVCTAVDDMRVEGLVGTLGGNDTAFIAMKSAEGCERLKQELDRTLEG
jgi:transcriptional regulator of arginine metabolism